MTTALEGRGLSIPSAAIAQINVRPWSTQFRMVTADGVVWSKAAAPGVAHEAPLLERFGAWSVPDILPLLAVDVPQAWLLLPDGGSRLRELAPHLRGDQDLDAWCAILPRYAALQRSLEHRVVDLVAVGVPDGSPRRYPDVLQALLDDDRVWSRVDATDRAVTDRVRRSLAAAMPRISAMADELDRSGIAATIDHGDIHGGNIFAGPQGYRFFDWGDSAIAHPFASMTTTLTSIAEKTGLDANGPELRRVTDAYTEAWTDILPRPTLTEVMRLAVDLGHIGKAAAWERALLGLEPEEMGGRQGATAAWLIDFGDRLDRRAGLTR